MTKKEVLENLDQVKNYIKEIETEEVKKSKIKIQIKNRFTGNILFESEKETIKEAVLEAKDSEANLYGADLREANLCEADLREANLCGAELMNAKFYGSGGQRPLTKKQLPDFLRALGFVLEN